MIQFRKIILFAILIPTVGLNGQTDSSSRSNEPRFTVGFSGGPNTFVFQDANNPPASKLGITGGLDLQFHFGKHSALVTNVMWEKKSYSNNYFYSGIINTYELNSITLPVLYRRAIGKKNIFFMNAGLFFSNQYSLKNSYSYNDRTTYVFNAGYAGIAAGFGSRIPLGKRMALTLEMRDHIRLVEVFTTNNHTYYDHNPPNITHTAKLLLGFSYGFGKKKINTRSTDSTRQRKLMVKLFYAPQLSGNALHSKNVRMEDSYYGNSHTSYSYDGGSEIPHSGQEAGIILEFLRRKHLNLNIGLTYDQFRFRTKATTLYYSGWGDLLGSYSGSSANTIIQYKFEFLSLSLTANYVFRKKNCSYYAGGGIEFSKLMSSAVQINYAYGYQKRYEYHLGSERNSYYKVDPINFFAVLNVGADFPLSKSASLFFEPFFKCGPPMEVPITTNIVSLWSVGSKVGFKF